MESGGKNRWRADLIGFLIGLVAGGGLALLRGAFVSPEAPAPAPPVVVPVEPVAAPPPDLTPAPLPVPEPCPILERQEATLAQARQRRDLVASRLQRHEGSPLPWTNDIPATYRDQAALQALASAALDGLSVEVNCDEVPCLLTWTSERTDGQDWLAVRQQLRDVFPGAEVVGDVVGVGAAATATIGALPPSIDPGEPQVARRVKRRTDLELGIEAAAAGQGGRRP